MRMEPEAMDTSDHELLKLARRRAKLKMGWYTHATIFLLVNLGLFVISLLTGSGRWHLWPLAGWGIGLAIHGLATWFALDGGGLRARMEADELQRLRDRR